MSLAFKSALLHNSISTRDLYPLAGNACNAVRANALRNWILPCDPQCLKLHRHDHSKQRDIVGMIDEPSRHSFRI